MRMNIEQAQKRTNLIMLGITEGGDERGQGLLETVTNVIEKDLGIEEYEVDQCYRLGRKVEATNRRNSRPVFIKFTRWKDKEVVWAQRRKLKNTGIIIKEDLPADVEENVRTLLPMLKEARSKNIKASLVRDNLILNCEKFTVKSLLNLISTLKNSPT